MSILLTRAETLAKEYLERFYGDSESFIGGYLAAQKDTEILVKALEKLAEVGIQWAKEALSEYRELTK